MRIKIIRQVKQIINKILGRLPYGMYRAITTKYDDMVIVDKTQRYRLAFFHRNRSMILNRGGSESLTYGIAVLNRK